MKGMGPKADNIYTVGVGSLQILVCDLGFNFGEYSLLVCDLICSFKLHLNTHLIFGRFCYVCLYDLILLCNLLINLFWSCLMQIYKA